MREDSNGRQERRVCGREIEVETRSKAREEKAGNRRNTRESGIGGGSHT